MTLLEVLITIGITLLLSSFLISYTSSSRQQIALYSEEVKLGQTIYRAKSLSLSLYSQPGSQPICGYGVHFDYSSMTYNLFSYNKPSDSSCGSINSISAGSKNTVSTFGINKNVKIVSPSGGRKIDDVLFIAPGPKTIINSNGTMISDGSAAVAIQTADGLLLFTITVNTNGLIDF